MPDDRKRRIPTPRPPIRPQTSDSLPPIDRESIAKWLALIDQRLSDQDEKQEQKHVEYERRFHLLERSFARMEPKIDELHEGLWKGRERDLSTSEEVSRLKAEIERKTIAAATKEAKSTGTEAGEEAGKEAGRKAARIYSGLAVIIAAILALIEHCGAVVKKLQ